MVEADADSATHVMVAKCVVGNKPTLDLIMTQKRL